MRTNSSVWEEGKKGLNDVGDVNKIKTTGQAPRLYQKRFASHPKGKEEGDLCRWEQRGIFHGKGRGGEKGGVTWGWKATGLERAAI